MNKSINKTEFSCSGHAHDHPKIYLKIPKGGNHVICPYCSKKFILDDITSINSIQNK